MWENAWGNFRSSHLQCLVPILSYNAYRHRDRYRVFNTYFRFESSWNAAIILWHRFWITNISQQLYATITNISVLKIGQIRCHLYDLYKFHNTLVLRCIRFCLILNNCACMLSYKHALHTVIYQYCMLPQFLHCKSVIWIVISIQKPVTCMYQELIKIHLILWENFFVRILQKLVPWHLSRRIPLQFYRNL